MSFNRLDVEELSSALNEPGWVTERRMESWRIAEEMELPNEKESEHWRYTDFRRLRFSLEPFRPARPSTSPSAEGPEQELMKAEGDRSGRLIQRDGSTVFHELDPELQSKGVILTDLPTAAAEHGNLVKENLFSLVDPTETIFSALHGALFSGGTFLYIPKGVEVAVPIESQRWISTEESAIFPHTLIVVEEGASLVYFERFRSEKLQKPALSNGATEVIIGQGARVVFASLQEYEDQVWHLQKQRFSSERDVTLRSLVVTLGARFSRVETDSIIKGEGSFSEMLSLYFASDSQHFDHRTLQEHVGGGSVSDLLYKGALKDGSRSVYSGLIKVHEKAAKTDAYQLNRNLVLSDRAKADTKPELEILNNDLRCTHGASVGQIGEEELYYLASRGIPRDQAERLIVEGFFQEVIDKVKHDELIRILGEAVDRKLAL